MIEFPWVVHEGKNGNKIEEIENLITAEQAFGIIYTYICIYRYVQ